MIHQLTAIIERENDGYVALCPEVDVASQGASVEEARDNLREALELFFETASSQEVKERLHREVFITHLEVGTEGPRNALRPLCRASWWNILDNIGLGRPQLTNSPP